MTIMLSRSAALRIVSIVVVGATWEILGRQAPVFASYPSAVASAFVDVAFTDGRLFPALSQTLAGMAVGFVIAMTLGMAIGFAMAMSRTVDIILDPYVNALYATPREALIPLLVLWAGVGFELRVTVVVLSAVFPIIINVHTGVKEVNTDYLETARVFVATRQQALRTVIIPGSLRFIFAGLRIGAARALTAITVAELAAAVTGMGALLLRFGQTLATDKVFALVLVIGVVGIVLGSSVQAIERRFVRGDPRA
jgi:NitT/TauT family transport system permease protein